MRDPGGLCVSLLRGILSYFGISMALFVDIIDMITPEWIVAGQTAKFGE
jgi:hypothetical protein